MMGIWSFRFVLWYLLILMTQPHFRFTFLIPFHLGDIAVAGGLGFHVLDCLSNQKPIIRFGTTTKLCLALVALSLTSHYFNPHQRITDWNVDIDGLIKVSVVMIILEAQLTSIQKAAALYFTMFLGTLWWLKGGVRLSMAGATWGSDDRLMGAHVSIIQNPNDFAYLTIFMLPLYFFLFQSSKNKYLKWVYLGCMGMAAVIALKTGSRTGLVALAAVGLFLLPRLFVEHKALLIGGIVAGLVVVNSPWLVGPKNVERFRTIPDSLMEMVGLKEAPKAHSETADEGSARIRWVKMRAAWNVIMKYPLLGVGTNPHGYVYEGNQNAGGKVHNEILMAGRHMGLGGMLLYALALILPFRMANRLRNAFKNAWPEVNALALAAQVQVVVVFVGGMLSPSLFHFPHMTMFVVVSAIYSNARELYPQLFLDSTHGVLPPEEEAPPPGYGAKPVRV